MPYRSLKLSSFKLILGFQPYFFAKETSITFLKTPFGFDLSYLIFIFVFTNKVLAINSK